MPPEVLAFLNATGQFPRNEFDLQAFNQGNAFGPGPQSFVPQAQNLNPGGQPFVGQDPFTRPGFFGPQTQPLQSQVDFAQTAPLIQQQPGVDPSQLGGPNPLQSPVQQISSPQLQPLQQSSVPSQQVPTPDLAEQVSRARLGGNAGGPRAGGGAASFGPGNFQGVGGVGVGAGGGAGQGLIQSGLQQQADVAQQRQLAASVLSSLIGGGGSLGGGALGGSRTTNIAG